MTSRFESEVIVVTGGSSGIGNAVARRVASEGASVVIGARREDVGDEAAASIRAAGIRAPADGTVAVDDGVPGGFVTAGTQLATAYDADKIFVTARVDETDIRAVRPGQQVDVTVDAFPSTPLIGYVREIQGGAAGQFALFPESNASGNF